MSGPGAPLSYQTVRLARGQHRSPVEGVCVMELASMLAGEPFTDRPRSVCRVIAAFLRACNDRFDDQTRQRLYRYASEAVGTGGDPAASAARVAHCARVTGGRTARPGVLFWRRRALQLPKEPLGPRLEGYVIGVVRSYPRSADGAHALLALADQLLAIGRDPVAAAPRDIERRPDPRSARSTSPMR